MDTENNLDLVVSTLEDENDGDFSAGDLSLREAIANAEFSNNFASKGAAIFNTGQLQLENNMIRLS